MTVAHQPAANSAWSAELRQILRQLQDDVLLWTLLGLFAFGASIAAMSAQSANLDRGLVLSVATFGIAAAVWSLRERHYRAAAIVLVAGALLLNLAAVAWVELTWMLALLALPTGLATLMLGAPVGLGIAGACTLALALLPETILPGSTEIRATALIGIWATAGMLWLVLRPLLTTVRWVWEGYAREHALLEHMQDTQVRLAQTLDDLTSANVQLTRLNQLADGLRQTAEEALRAKEQFVANVSHELRTPLNMIIGFSEMIVSAPQVYGNTIPGALLADLSVILRNSRHLSDLIDDVLDLSQIEAGHMALVKERVDLREIVEAATVAVRPLFESKGLSLGAQVQAGLPAIFCDRTRIREVLLNLLSNAGRFTEHGGARVSVSHAAGSPDIMVSVSDTGPGIAGGDKGKVFQPFQQLDGSIRRRYGGSGLGLTISKSFVELHGGRMWFDSAPGSGTTFYFSLPVDPPTPAEDGATRWLNPDWPNLERTHAPLAPPPAVKPRLVVIDPRGALQRLLARYLDDTDVTPAPDLPAAVDELARVPSQALVVNSMQVDDWLLRLGSAAELPHGTPAIICSVPSQTDFATDLGVAGYLVKPIDQDELLNAVNRAVAGAEPDQPAQPDELDEPSEPAQPPTVLVVDDEPDALRLFWRMLSGSPRGYRVLTAGDGQQAMEIMRAQRPDAILLDLVMPEVSGFQFLALKNADPDLRPIPVLITSARDPAGQPIVSNAIGVTRPGGLSLHQLLACVESISRLLSPLSDRTQMAR